MKKQKNKKQKILQINSVVNSGSTGRIAEDIGKKILDSGWESFIAYARNDSVSKSTLVKIGNSFDIRMHGLKTRLFDLHGFASSRATQNFIREIENINPDLIQLHNLHGYYLNIDILFDFLRSFCKPIIFTLHDCWAFTGHCSHFDYCGCERWKSECYACPLKREYPRSFFWDGSRRNYRNKKKIFSGIKDLTIVTPSNWLAGFLKDSFLGEYPVAVINNGIEMKFFRHQESNFRSHYQLENKFIILGVASVFGQRKGYDYFIDLQDTIQDDEKIVLVGLTKKQVKNLPEGIIGIEKTESVSELADIYSAADVFLNPTLEDNFPTTNIESLACGTPVITFDTGGSPESLDEHTGIAVPRGDMNALIDAIAEIKHNGKNYYTHHCQERAKKFYDKNDRFADYLDLYQNVLSNRVD